MAGQQNLIESLHRYGLRKRKLRVERGLALSGGGLCVVLAAAAASDRLFMLSPELRFAILLLLTGSLLSSLVCLVVIPFSRAAGERKLAAEVQDRFPELGDRILTAVELSRQDAGGRVSKALVKAVIADAEKSASGTDFTEACDRRPFVRAMIGLGGALCILAAYGLVFPRPLMSCLKRLIDPFGGHALYTYTTVTVSPGNASVPRGEPVRLQADIGGAVPGQVTFYVRREGGSWEKHVVKPDEGVFRFHVEALYEKVWYSVRAGDGRSPTCELSPVDRPVVTGVSVRCEYPRYTHRKPYVIENPVGGFSVMRGGSYSITVQTSKPVTMARLVFPDGAEELSRVDGRWQSAPLRPEKGEAFEIVVEDESGISNAGPPRLSLVIRKDEPPALSVHEPEGNIDVLADEPIMIRAFASDDFGLVTLEMPFIIKPGDGIPGRILLASSTKEPKDLKAQYEWRISRHGVEPGFRIEFAVQAMDNCEPEPNVTTAMPRVIRVISHAEHLDRIADRQEEIAGRLARLLKRQTDGMEAVESISLLDDDKLAGKEMSGEIFLRADDQRMMAGDAGSVAEDLSGLIDEMRKNRFVDKGSIVTAASVRGALVETADGPISAAEETLRAAGSSDSAGRRRGNLTSASSRQHDVARRLRELIAMLREDTELMQVAGIRRHLEELAGRQEKAVFDAAMVAPRTAGKAAGELPAGEKEVLSGIAQRQKRLEEDADRLISIMEKVATKLSFVRSDLAEKVDVSRNFLMNRKVPGRMKDLTDTAANNRLFAYGKDGEEIVSQLRLAATMLDTEDDRDVAVISLLELMRMIERQEELRRELAELEKQDLNDQERKARLEEIRAEQEKLAGMLAEVLGKARGMNRVLLGALEDMCRAMSGSLSSMGGACSSMGAGRTADAMSEQDNAAKLLREALESMNRMTAAGMEELAQMSEALRRLKEILEKQKDLARKTEKYANRHGDGPHELPQALALNPLARRQQSLGNITASVVEDWPDSLSDPDRIDEASSEMGRSAGLMLERLTNREVLESQKRAIALLENMMDDAASAAAGAAGLKMVPMLLSVPGSGGGGYEGGTVRDLQRRRLDDGKDDWSKLPREVRERLLEGWQDSYPPEFRQLLELYFERIRE